MKTYPSIPAQVPPDLRGLACHVFGKLDGSNIRAEWSPKRGFWKFGTRNRLLDDSSPQFHEARDLILAYEQALGQRLRSQGIRRATLFYEFWGPGSFAGQHVQEPHKVTLLDIAGDRGILAPGDFLRSFQGVVETAPLLYFGLVDQGLIEAVRTGTLPGMPPEGVVVKGPWVSPGRPLMFKIKTDAWISRVGARYGHDPALLTRLL